MDDYDFFSGLLLRTPAFSYTDFATNQLPQLLKNPYFQKSLLVASPVFYRQLENCGFRDAKLNDKEKHTVLKYFNRACFRPTPFGLFSAFSVVNWGKGDPIIINQHRLHIQPEFAAGMHIVQADRSLEDASRLYNLNGAVYTAGRERRYLASAANEAKGRFDFSIRSVAAITALRQLDKYAGQRLTYNAWLEVLITFGNSVANSELLLNELIAQCYLNDNLTPNITGKDYACLAAGTPPRQVLITGHQPAEQTQLAGRYLNTEGLTAGSLTPDYRQRLKEALNCLDSLSAKTLVNPNLTAFITAFVKKFDNQSVPLLYALDPEVGLGYGELSAAPEGPELIRELDWPAPAAGAQTLNWTPAHHLLLRKWQENSRSISITETDLADLASGPAARVGPPSLSVMFRLVGDQLFIETSSSCGATALPGRFTPFNPNISALARSIAEQEAAANPEVIFAELCYCGDWRTANIDRREMIYDFEIPVLVSSLQPLEKQIPLASLWLKIVNGQLILFSKTRNKRIIPRLSSAYNYTHSDLAVFRLLCDLQHQGIDAIVPLELRHYFPGLDFYPRVEYRDTILQPATWYVDDTTFKEAIEADGDGQQNHFAAARHRLGLTDRIALTVHDHQLVFDLNRPEEVVFFLNNIRNEKKAVIREFFLPSETVTIQTDGKCRPLVNQFIASLYKTTATYSGLPPNTEPILATRRKLTPGSDWLYFKIYCHPSRLDELLNGRIRQLILHLQRKELISEWFFVRYADPGYHLRLRFKLKSGAFGEAASLTSGILDRLLRQEMISDFSIAIYDRELERYGHRKITEFETLFFSSSKLVTTCLAVNYPREQLAFSAVRLILECFGINGRLRLHYLENIIAHFGTEFRADKALLYQLDQRFRGGMIPQEELFMKDSRLKRSITDFKKTYADFYARNRRQPPARLHRWLQDLIHMHLNRLFTEDSRKQEFVLYYLFYKYEKSLQARARRNTVEL